jgi:uncharacterized membrane protein
MNENLKHLIDTESHTERHYDLSLIALGLFGLFTHKPLVQIFALASVLFVLISKRVLVSAIREDIIHEANEQEAKNWYDVAVDSLRWLAFGMFVISGVLYIALP